MSEAYKIVIKSEGGSNTPKTPIAGNNKQSTSTQPQTQESTINGLQAGVVGYVAVKKYVAPFVKQGLQYSISTVGLRTGNMERQARMQSAYNIGSQIFGIAESIAIGAVMGGVGGAVVGAVMGVATTAISYAQQQNTINLNKTIEDQTISMMNVRSGATNGNRR